MSTCKNKETKNCGCFGRARTTDFVEHIQLQAFLIPGLEDQLVELRISLLPKQIARSTRQFGDASVLLFNSITAL